MSPVSQSAAGGVADAIFRRPAMAACTDAIAARPAPAHSAEGATSARRSSRKPILPGLILGAVVALTLAAVCVPAAWLTPRSAFRGLGWCGAARTPSSLPRVARRFLQNTFLDPDHWKQKYFIADSLDQLLPQGKPKQEMVVIYMEPTDARHLSYLKYSDTTSKAAWYLGKVYYVGTTMWEADGERLDILRKEAVAMGAEARFESWTSAGQRWSFVSNAVDMIIISDGGLAGLGLLLEPALTEARRVLKDDGRFYFVANNEDEASLKGQSVENGLKNSVFDRVGFDLLRARRRQEGDLVVACLTKRKFASKAAKQKVERLSLDAIRDAVSASGKPSKKKASASSVKRRRPKRA